VKFHCGKDAIPFKKTEAAGLAATTGESEVEEGTDGVVHHARFAHCGVFNTTSSSTYSLRDSILFD